jgi:DNA-binding Xre family transcriptional regulator
MDFEHIQATVCRRIKDVRLAKGMTQEDFEIETDGITARKIRSIESGAETNIELKTLLKFCRLAGVHPQELFDFDLPWADALKKSAAE